MATTPPAFGWCRRSIIIAVGLPLVGIVLLYWNAIATQNGFANYRKEMKGRMQDTRLPTTTSSRGGNASLQQFSTEYVVDDIAESLQVVDNEEKRDANSAAPSSKPSLTLVVQLRGEMGNWLSSLVFAKGIQWWVRDHRDDYPFTLENVLVGERQAGIKWKIALKDVQACFPNLRMLRVDGGRWDPEFVALRQELKVWLGESSYERLIIDRGDSDCGTKEWFCLWSPLRFVQELFSNTTTSNFGGRSTNRNYSVPLLISNQMASFDVLVDQYYDEIREFLAFDYQTCCNPNFQPMQNESVFHLRNFRAEMGDRNYYQKGYEELTPHQVAHELLQHLPRGAHVALTARGTEHVQGYLDALTHERGFHVRTTPAHHTGVQDFCFLLQAQHELVGTLRSTYTRWAALLGRANTARLYSIDRSWTRHSHASGSANKNTNLTSDLHYQWKQPALRSKIVYHAFASSQST